MQSTGACGALSLLTPLGYQSGDCGYCKEPESSQRTPDSRGSYYATTKSLCPEHYQQLMDRGWRRSGTLLYLPDASRSCCVHYTIRLPARDFSPVRDQRQALHRWNRFVLGKSYIKEATAKHPKSKEQKKRQNNTFDLVATVHEGEHANLKPDIKPDHRFDVTLEPDTFTTEKFQLFQNYQKHVHHETDNEVSPAGFRRFLCSSPLHRHDSAAKNLGSFHHCYRLDGRLIAMAVLDLLPHAVSGVYFIYHSDFEKWSLGKLSALREAALAREGGYEYYYMGYYIHGCKKMRYKGEYVPQHVLDYDTLQWDPLDDEMRALMDRRQWVSMSRERRVREETARRNAADDAEAAVEQELAAKVYETSRPNPVLATMDDRLSLLDLGMPGVMSRDQLREGVDLDEMKLHLGMGRVHATSDLMSWDDGDESDPTCLKGAIAEYAACVGPRIAREVVIDMARAGR